jgi:hypothetical protein
MDAFCCQFRLSALLRYWPNDVHQSWPMDLHRSDHSRLIWHKRGGFKACATQEGHPLMASVSWLASRRSWWHFWSMALVLGV